MRTIHAIMALVAGMPIGFGIISACTSCRAPAPVEPDVIIVVPPDAHPALIDAADACMSACDNLEALGCPDGVDQLACLIACRHIVSSRLTTIDLACITSAHSKAEARACGQVCR